MKVTKFKNVKVGQVFFTATDNNPKSKYVKMTGKTGFNGVTIPLPPSFPVFVKGSVLD